MASIFRQIEEGKGCFICNDGAGDQIVDDAAGGAEAQEKKLQDGHQMQ